MAGLLYLYRLFIYHVDFGKYNTSVHHVLSIMESKLFKYITVPAMLASFVTGGSMTIINPGLFSQTWFIVKVACAVIMAAFTIFGFSILSRFHRQDFSRFSSLGLRLLNEVPTVLMVIIVIMVIIRPGT
jgi:putative membrane protein